MEKIKIRLNEFKAHKSRIGLLVEVNGEGVIDIVPSREEISLSKFIYFEEKERGFLTENDEIQLEVADNEEISFNYEINEGMFSISVWGEESPFREIRIPVKSNWTVNYRNRRSIGKVRVNGGTICCTIRRKG